LRLPVERDQRCVRSSLCFPQLKLRAPVPCLFPGPASPTLRRAWSRWVAAHRAEDESVSRRSASLRRTAQEWWGRSLPPTRLRDRTSDAPVATLTRYRCALFSRCALFIHRFGESRQDRFHHAVVTRRDFSRPEAPSIDRKCAALAPTSRPAIAHLSSPGFPQRIAPGVFLGPARAVVATNARSGSSASSSPLAPRGTSGRRIARPRTWRARHCLTRRSRTIVHPVAKPMFTATPERPCGRLRLGEGLLWVRAACRLLQRDYSIRAHPRASRPRPPRIHAPLARSNDPLAFARRLPSRSTPPAARRGSTTQSGFA